MTDILALSVPDYSHSLRGLALQGDMRRSCSNRGLKGYPEAPRVPNAGCIGARYVLGACMADMGISVVHL
jgi:hypothetical protein